MLEGEILIFTRYKTVINSYFFLYKKGIDIRNLLKTIVGIILLV